MRPPLPSVLTRGRPAIGVGSSVPLRMTRSRPGRSVTSRLPSGRKAMAHGCDRPLVTTVKRILCCSAVSNTNGPAPNGGTGTPIGGCWGWPAGGVAGGGETKERKKEVEVVLLSCGLIGGAGGKRGQRVIREHVIPR